MRVPSSVLFSIFLNKMVLGEISITYKFPNAAMELLTIFKSNNSSDILNHGCWCSKLNPTADQSSLGGSIVHGEIDRLCKSWIQARKCLRESVCEFQSSWTFYSVESELECSENIEDACLSASCKVDMFFTGEVLKKTSVPNFEFLQNSVCEFGNSAGGNLDCDAILVPVLDTTTVPVVQTTTVISTAESTTPMATTTTVRTTTREPTTTTQKPTTTKHTTEFICSNTVFQCQFMPSTCTIDCGLKHGYFPDASDCRNYCYCSGDLNVPSRIEKCNSGTFWDPDCGDVGCCNHIHASNTDECEIV